MKALVRIEELGDRRKLEREVEDGRDVDDFMVLVRGILRDEIKRNRGGCVSIVLSVHPLEGCEHEHG